jgi:flavin reductase (DIM6/NTAB) family NADH-FMN oxidoreductase RutF
MTNRFLEATRRIHDVAVVDESFDELMGMLDYPVFVVTAQADGQPSGCLVSFANQASVEPPIFQVGISKSTDTCAVASRSQYLAVHVLARHHRALAELFGGHGDDSSKFHRSRWRAGPQGMPILDDAIAWFVGRAVGRLEVGDHVQYMLQPVATWAPDCSDDPLYLSDIDDIDPGHEETHRMFGSAPADPTPRYGLRFTLDGL